MRKGRFLDYLTSLLFLLPNFSGFLLFTLGPTIASLILSFTNWDLLSPPHWVGIKNLITLIGFHKTSGGWKPNDFYFWYALWNTIFYMLFIPVQMGLSLLMALLFNRKVKGVVFFRTVYFLPTICSGVAIAILWRWLYNPDFGLINYLLSKIGIHGPQWLASTKWAKPAIAIMGVWVGLGGYNTILYLAALQGVPRDPYEASMVDGANPWQRFRYVTWPSLSPTTFFVFIMSVIGGFQGGFMQAYLMTGGGPAFSTTTVNYYIFNNAYQWFKMGYASTISWILFIFVFIVTLINWRFGGKRVHYI